MKNFPSGLSNEFAQDLTRQALWRAFLNKNKLPQSTLANTILFLQGKLQPALAIAAGLTGNE